MRLYYDLQIDGKPVIIPDSDITVELTDLDDADSGRDESGIMHRIVLREKVKSIPLSYASIPAEEYAYMESLFSGKSTFQVTYRSVDGSTGEFTGYRAKHSITFHNAKTGQCRNYNFSIVEC